MKPKTLSKKLTLKKRTIADLSGNEMIKVKGGCIESQTSCDSEIICCLPRTVMCPSEPCTKFEPTCVGITCI